jgi:inner membrane protein
VIGSHPATPAVLLGVVVGCDLLLPAARPRLAAMAALDESAHLATAGLVVAAALPADWPARHWRTLATVLAGAVLLDLDHIPLYLGFTAIAPGGRPLTHSLATPLLTTAVGMLLPARARRAVLAAGLGVCLHLVRDLATGPGVSLCWPITTESLVVPYPWYLATLGALGAVATGRRRRRG